MKLTEYQQAAGKFAVYGVMSLYPFLALAEESGEVMGKIAKYQRKFQEQPMLQPSEERALTAREQQLRSDLMKELGDVLWQVQQCATELGIDLALVAKNNLQKLYSRSVRGTIVGEGDDR